MASDDDEDVSSDAWETQSQGSEIGHIASSRDESVANPPSTDIHVEVGEPQPQSY